MAQGKHHMQHIDVLKGIVIFLVVVGHSFHFGFSYYRSPLLAVLRSIDMPIFVFLSGYLASKPLEFSFGGHIAFWRKKARQLFLPLITLPTLYALFYSVSFDEMLFGIHHGGYWFTWVLFEMFVLWFVFQLLNHYTNPEGDVTLETLWAMLTLAFVLWVDLPWKAYSPMTHEAFSWGKMNYLYHNFLIGYFVGKYSSFERILIRPEVTALSALLFTLLIYTECTSAPVMGGIPASLSGLVMAFGLVNHLGKGDSRLNRLAGYLGQESRTIYFTHYFFLFSVPMVKPFLFGILRDGGRTISWEIGLSVLYAAIVVSITLMVVRLIKANSILAFLCYGKALPKNKKPKPIVCNESNDTSISDRSL